MMLLFYLYLGIVKRSGNRLKFHHSNSIFLSLYTSRLHGQEQDFFTPYDLEISNEELNYVCRKSEQWRGEEGERKKTAVYDYIWEEEEVWLV